MSFKIIIWVKIFYSAKDNHLSRNDILLLSTIPIIFKHTVKKQHKENNLKILFKMWFLYSSNKFLGSERCWITALTQIYMEVSNQKLETCQHGI